MTAATMRNALSHLSINEASGPEGAAVGHPNPVAAPAATWRRLLNVRQDLPVRVGAGLSAGAFAAALGLWWLIAWSGWVDPLFLPSPLAVAGSAFRAYAADRLWVDLGISIYRVVVGFALAAAVGVPLGLLMGSFQAARSLFEPLLAFVRYMPATAFIPLLVLWLGIDDGQKFAVIWIGTFFHLTLLIMASTLSVPLPLIEAGMMLGAGRRQLVARIIWPAAKPLIFDNLRIVLGWAWTYIVVAEIVAAESGIGYQILKASRFLDTAMIFVGILSIGAVGIVSDLALNGLAARLFPYIQRSRA